MQQTITTHQTVVRSTPQSRQIDQRTFYKLQIDLAKYMARKEAERRRVLPSINDRRN